MSRSVSSSLKWLPPFICGLDGSLSDRTMTSSGEEGLFSFLTSLQNKWKCKTSRNAQHSQTAFHKNISSKFYPAEQLSSPPVYRDQINATQWWIRYQSSPLEGDTNTFLNPPQIFRKLVTSSQVLCEQYNLSTAWKWCAEHEWNIFFVPIHLTIQPEGFANKWTWCTKSQQKGALKGLGSGKCSFGARLSVPILAYRAVWFYLCVELLTCDKSYYIAQSQTFFKNKHRCYEGTSGVQEN